MTAGSPAVQASAPLAAPWRVVGTVENLSDPSKSFAVLSSGHPPNVMVHLSKCERVNDEPLRCMYDGFWYSESGRATTAAKDDGPLKMWTQPAPSVAQAAVPVLPRVEPVPNGDSRPLAKEDGYDLPVPSEDPVSHVISFHRPGGLAHSGNRN